MIGFIERHYYLSRSIDVTGNTISDLCTPVTREFYTDDTNFLTYRLNELIDFKFIFLTSSYFIKR